MPDRFFCENDHVLELSLILVIVVQTHARPVHASKKEACSYGDNGGHNPNRN